MSTRENIRLIARASFINYDVVLFLKIGLILAKSADPDKRQHFIWGLQYWPKYFLRGCQYTKR